MLANLEAALLPIVVNINNYLSSYILIVLLIGVGLFYSIRTKFVQVRCFGEGMKKVFGGLSLRGGKLKSGMTSFQALATAIAAQVGTGNIVGASGAILTGGPGAIFWMWIIAFLGMATIYAEATLAQKTRVVDKDGNIHGGPVYYITTAFKGGFGKFLAGFFAVAIILALALGGKNITSTDGNGTQGGSTTTSASASTTDPTKLNADMTAIKAEIDSMAVADFTETTETTEYVKLTIKHYGDVVIRLRPDIAPITVANFQKLVGEGFYNGLTFHRIYKGFMIQGGDPKGDGTGGSGTTIKGEFRINGVQNDLSHITGVISMARRSTPYDSATSQFFICNADASASLDGSYAGFGYVVAGLDVILTVSEVEVTTNSSGENSLPLETVVIENICFVKKN